MSTNPTEERDPRLQDRPVALITGGGTGIGAASARRLAADGYRVLLAGRRPDRLESTAERINEEFPDSATTVVLDVTSDSSVHDALDGLPRLDVLVNNAGGALGRESIEQGDLLQWEQMYASNVIGLVRVTQTALPLLRESPHATIVNIGSIAGQVAYEGGGGYVAAKHGTSTVSDILRLELNGEHVRVIELRPGMVHTDEFSLTRFGGDQQAADAVYDGVDHPLTAADVAECVGFVVGLPQHVNIDSMVIKPVAQAQPYKLHRGPIDWKSQPGEAS